MKVDRKKKREREGQEIFARGLQISNLNKIWSVGLGTTLRDRQKIKYYFSSFKDFFGKSRWCHIVELRMYYKHTKFKQNR